MQQTLERQETRGGGGEENPQSVVASVRSDPRGGIGTLYNLTRVGFTRTRVSPGNPARDTCRNKMVAFSVSLGTHTRAHTRAPAMRLENTAALKEGDRIMRKHCAQLRRVTCGLNVEFGNRGPEPPHGKHELFLNGLLQYRFC